MLLGRLKAWQGRLEKERREHRLRYLFWETTRACNLRCRHCGSDCAAPVSGELTGEEMKGVFKSIAGAYDARSIMVAATGGEPLLRKDLFDVMGYAHGLGFSWGIVTNGMLVDPGIVGQCRDAGMGTVTVSVDGLKATHEFIRKGGSFERAIGALRLFGESGHFRVVQATTCASQYNVDELQGLYELFRGMGVDEWRLLTVSPIGRARGDPKFRLEPGQLRSLLDFIAGKRLAGGMRVTFEEEGFLGVEYEGRVRDALFYCPAGINIAGIMADGGIGACPSLPAELVQGNVRKDDFREVWETRYGVMRDPGWRHAGPCGGCAWWEFCRGNSLHLWDFQKGMPAVCHLRELEAGRR